MYTSVVIFLPSLKYSAVLFCLAREAWLGLFGILWLVGCEVLLLWWVFLFVCVRSCVVEVFFGGGWIGCGGFCFSKREFLLSGVLLQAKCRLALDMSDKYSESTSEPVHGKVSNLTPAVGGFPLAGT